MIPKKKYFVAIKNQQGCIPVIYLYNILYSLQGGGWLKCSKQATSPALTSYSRRDAFEFKLPQTKCPRSSDDEVVVSDKPKSTTDPLGFKSIPLLSLLEKWKSELSFFQKEAKGYYYLQHGAFCFNMSNLQDMIKMHYARDTQKAVEAELNRRIVLAESYLKPANVTKFHQGISGSALRKPI